MAQSAAHLEQEPSAAWDAGQLGVFADEDDSDDNLEKPHDDHDVPATACEHTQPDTSGVHVATSAKLVRSPVLCPDMEVHRFLGGVMARKIADVFSNLQLYTEWPDHGRPCRGPSSR